MYMHSTLYFKECKFQCFFYNFLHLIVHVPGMLIYLLRF